MTVTYFVMDHSMSTLGFTGAGSGEEDLLPEVEELDPNEIYSMVFEDLERIDTVGDDTVGCGNVDPVRKGEAANQIGPRLFQVQIGQAVRINYGTGESELFVITCKTCSMPAEPVPGSCG